MSNILSKTDIDLLESTAFKVREKIIKMATGGGCFIGASLSCADILVYLYKKFLNISPYILDDPSRDYLFLSKGHDVPALYAVLSECGIIDEKRLANHLKANDFIYWHPNVMIPGVEFHSGSLGHLLSVAIGVALDCKNVHGRNRIVVILGDGELNEGSIWEACLTASAYKLDNLLVILDRNHFQANMETEKLIPLEPLEDKFEAFEFAVSTINGHSFDEISNILAQFPFERDKPSVIIADTVRGKGVPSLEARADRWFCNFTENEVSMLIDELYGKDNAQLTSHTLTVR
jgi:transketolase